MKVTGISPQPRARHVISTDIFEILRLYFDNTPNDSIAGNTLYSLDVHMNPVISLEGLGKAGDTAFNGRFAVQRIPENRATHDEAPAASMNAIIGANADIIAVRLQPDEDVVLVGILEKGLAVENISVHDIAPFGQNVANKLGIVLQRMSRSILPQGSKYLIHNTITCDQGNRR